MYSMWGKWLVKDGIDKRNLNTWDKLGTCRKCWYHSIELVRSDMTIEVKGYTPELGD